MRVLQIGAAYVGAQKAIERAIHDDLISKGNSSTIFYSIGTPDQRNIVSYESFFSIFLRRVLRKVFGKNPHFALLSTLKLISKIKKNRPDLIHIHVIHHGYLDYEYLLKWLAKKEIPVVFTAHDMWFFTGGCYYYSTIKCDGFKNGCHDCPECEKKLDCKKKDTNKYLQKKIKLFSSLRNVAFVSVSPWVFEEMKKSAIASYPQYMVMNSVNEVDYVPFIKEKRKKFTIIGVAANWDERKGLSRFYELGSALEGICDIILVGSVCEELKASAPSNIIFYGYTSSVNELYDLYASCDLHVSMSFEETFGLTFVEAAVSGIRSMGFNSTAIPAVLQKTHGYIISSCTVDEVAQKIRELAQTREKCIISQDEYLEIRNYFSPQRMASEYQKVYEKTLNFKE